MFDRFWSAVVEYVWGLPMVLVLIGSGLYFTIISRVAPFRHLLHAVEVVCGKYDQDKAPGEISHFQALTTALSATLGLGNIAGVAIALTTGGPGAVFWMWVAGIVGMATKFFTCTLSCLYRKQDADGVMQGGPMYFIEVGLGERFKPLAVLFAVAGLIGCLTLFQVNQLAEMFDHMYDIPRLLTGLVSMIFVGMVIIGGIKRVGAVTARLVPFMAVLYVVSALVIIVGHARNIPAVLGLIVHSAFTGGAVIGGVAGVTFRQTLVSGIKRAAFSNEAGIGTAPMAHGAARTSEPVREGLVAMLGPFIDTNIVCTLTALMILLSRQPVHCHGVSIVLEIFTSSIPVVGGHLLSIIIMLFSVSTMVSYSYYSKKCASYLFGPSGGNKYIYVYLAVIPLGAVWSQVTVVNIIDSMFAVMAFPTLVAAIMLSPRVLRETRDYFSRLSL